MKFTKNYLRLHIKEYYKLESDYKREFNDI